MLVLILSIEVPPFWSRLQSLVLLGEINFPFQHIDEGYALLIPEDSGHPEDFMCDSLNSNIGIAIGRSPEFRQTSASRIMDQFHCPAELSDKVQIGEGCHVWMCPSVHTTDNINNEARQIKWDKRDVILKCLERREEFFRVFENIGTDEEVGRVLIVLLKELV
jgi:hypothetical protein